ncbi:hypothetical protein M6B38_238750 [Iris pallida]|uniref:Uncharacterized protein n=1 Tax=Iris pallida TaxID=29817 RepID=A0AAX6DLS1_IRIPA|nr:hypothetical protein M6B38_238750 [Iris pallida]
MKAPSLSTPLHSLQWKNKTLKYLHSLSLSLILTFLSRTNFSPHSPKYKTLTTNSRSSSSFRNPSIQLHPLTNPDREEEEEHEDEGGRADQGGSLPTAVGMSISASSTLQRSSTAWRQREKVAL